MQCVLLYSAYLFVGIVLCMGRGPKLCVNLVVGCLDSAVRKILLPRKIYRTVTAPPHSLNT